MLYGILARQPFLTVVALTLLTVFVVTVVATLAKLWKESASVLMEYRTSDDWQNDALDKARQAMQRMDRDIDELRAILAPLLDDPWIYPDDEGSAACPFCRAESRRPEVRQHKPDCPVLRKDELLGRA